jgi:hypothetical protein
MPRLRVPELAIVDRATAALPAAVAAIPSIDGLLSSTSAVKPWPGATEIASRPRYLNVLGRNLIIELDVDPISRNFFDVRPFQRDP